MIGNTLTVGLRNNNPGNLKRWDNSTPYKGEILPNPEPPWRYFQSMAYGYRAMFHLIIVRYIMDYGLNTLHKVMHRYAPTSENDTQNYIDHMVQQTGITAHEPIDITNHSLMLAIGRAISFMENGVMANETHLQNGYNMLMADINTDGWEQIIDEGRNPNDWRNTLIIAGSAILLAGVFFLGKKAKT